MTGIIGRKLGMTQIFEDTGAVVPVTVVEAGPCPIVQVRTTAVTTIYKTFVTTTVDR